MKAYYASNPDKWVEHRLANKEKINEAKKLKYKNDPETRDYYKANTKRWRELNPNRKHESHIMATYGLDVYEYETILRFQEERCAICRSESPGGRIKRFHVDHNHATGEIRGLLCSRCNLCIGLFKDNEEIIRRAADYLEGR